MIRERNAQAQVAGILPPRYNVWRQSFDELVQRSLKGECAVLDVGAGRKPTFPRDRRSPNCYYAGLDLSAAELAKAPPGSYDGSWASDITRKVPELEGRFDLVLSWQVLEHVKPLDASIENIRSYLRPGGRLIATLSGAFSTYGLINQVVPARVGVWAMSKLLGRDPETVFPAYYDHCWQTALERMLSHWTRFEVVPFYIGASYFRFSRTLQRIYLGYEDWALRGKHFNLATHYLIDATK
ncbi:MAG: class I SAM-dependent methyltransferase [Candidatus Binatus sp.]|uniref:class I SAM-dependent methyltransferase n=1 Tax=Candidatus Binatus sp. TaxID=2811406 RepID=UPI002716D8B7|nr:class I SAM-dependent methyltransferase [Candidatus Binatus sp.]MDO8432772.1 class I SAM-dependent methyltransferase [Candidatus Binatus sp.]